MEKKLAVLELEDLIHV